MILLPAGELARNVDVADGQVSPRYLGSPDAPWLRALLTEFAAHEGRPLSAWRERLREPLPVRAPKAKRMVAANVLHQLTLARPSFSVAPRLVRVSLFRTGSDLGVAGALEQRGHALALVAAELDLAPEAVEASLFADLRHERRVAPLPRGLSPLELALETNLALAMSLLARSSGLSLRAFGNTRALVRHARLHGLICTIRLPMTGGQQPDEAELHISGPLSLFRHTTLYGRRLASLLPRLAWCHEYRLEAACSLARGADEHHFRLESGDPLPAGRELAPFDSRIEERFAREFARLASNWDLVREPEPVSVGHEAQCFPDFALVHRQDPSERWLLEIVGFWTPAYLATKLAHLAAMKQRLLLCVDATLACRDDELPQCAHVLRYDKRIDAARVLAHIEGEAGRSAARGR